MTLTSECGTRGVGPESTVMPVREPVGGTSPAEGQRPPLLGKQNLLFQVTFFPRQELILSIWGAAREASWSPHRSPAFVRKLLIFRII